MNVDDLRDTVNLAETYVVPRPPEAEQSENDHNAVTLDEGRIVDELAQIIQSHVSSTSRRIRSRTMIQEESEDWRIYIVPVGISRSRLIRVEQNRRHRHLLQFLLDLNGQPRAFMHGLQDALNTSANFVRMMNEQPEGRPADSSKAKALAAFVFLLFDYVTPATKYQYHHIDFDLILKRDLPPQFISYPELHHGIDIRSTIRMNDRVSVSIFANNELRPENFEDIFFYGPPLERGWGKALNWKDNWAYRHYVCSFATGAVGGAIEGVATHCAVGFITPVATQLHLVAAGECFVGMTGGVVLVAGIPVTLGMTIMLLRRRHWIKKEEIAELFPRLQL